MVVPRRLKRLAGRHARVDGIPFHLPINSERTPALMAGFTIDADRAARLLPASELYPLRLGRRGLLIVTVLDYRSTDIGPYIEFSVGIACTRGPRPAPPLLPLLLPWHYGVGQYVVDLPVSTEISVKGGKGIWGMPKHRASLDFLIGREIVSSQYDLDGQMVMRIDVARPRRAWLPVRASAVNYCQFRGMVMKSAIHFRGRLGLFLRRSGSARLTLGPHPRAEALRELGIARDPVFSGFFPATTGILDDHCESWFVAHEREPETEGEGLESVVSLGMGREWPAPPRRPAEAPAVSVPETETV